MKRKLVLCAMIFFVGLMLFGCNKSISKTIEENVSELTKVYYAGENKSIYVTLTSGVREKQYIMDGKSGEKTQFSLLSVYFKEDCPYQTIKALVDIDGDKMEAVLEINGLNHAYMFDLEKGLDGSEEIKVEIDGKVLLLENVSQTFAIDYSDALAIAGEEFADKISKKKKLSGVNAEFYLRILDKNLNNFDELFWSFSILTADGENLSVIISTQDGSILAKS